MQILAQMDKTYMLDVEIDDTIKSIKYKIQDKTGISGEEQRILFNGKQLDDKMRLNDYNIINLSVINVVSSLTNISSNKPTQKITLNIDLSNISPFGKSTDATELDMECDDTITMDSIFNYLQLSDLSNYLQIIFYHKKDADIDSEICFKYQQIENKTIFEIENIIHTQYVGIPNNYQHELYMKLYLNQKISSFSKQAITCKLNEFFEGKDEFNGLEIDIMTQLLSLMGTLKSNDSMDILLHEIADCLCIFTQYGVPEQIIKNANQYLIPSIFKLFSYTNCNDDHMNEVIKRLTKCLFNIISKDPEYYRNVILNELENFCDPSQNNDCLCNIITFYHELIKNSPSEYIEQRVLEQIYILLFYEDDPKVVMNALTVYHKYVNWWPDMIEENVSDECVWIMRKKYGRKQAQNKLMFTGFIHKSLKQSDIEYIPNDLFTLIFKYYDCYQNIQPNMMWRVMELLHKNKNGYCQDITSEALKITKEIITPLNALQNVLFDKNMLQHLFYENGLIEGLFVLMNDMECCFHGINSINDKQHECWQCGKEKMCIKDINTDSFYCIECCRQLILVQILNVIQDLLEENNIKDLCLDQIECLNKFDFWIKMKEKTETFVLPHIAPQFLEDDTDDDDSD